MSIVKEKKQKEVEFTGVDENNIFILLDICRNLNIKIDSINVQCTGKNKELFNYATHLYEKRTADAEKLEKLL